jgi:ferredoxin
MVVVNPNFMKEIRNYGALNITDCFNCGNCTVICPLTTSNSIYPRKVIRYAQLGLEDKILQAIDPWLCYHCGECTDSCPRKADPGEIMMALRRYMITKYSCNRIAEKLYSSKLLASLFFTLFTLITAVGIFFFHGPIAQEGVELSLFIPSNLVDIVGLSLGAFAILSIVANSLKIYRHVSKGHRIVFSIRKLIDTLFREVIVQVRYSKCKEKTKWITHVCVVTGFLGLGITTTLAFIIDPAGIPEMVPIGVRAMGTISGLVFVFGCLSANWRRLTGKEARNHFTDWVFLELLLAIGLSGLLLEVTSYLSLALVSYILYATHLIAIALLLVIAPYHKFVHAVYRSLAVYVAKTVDE